MRKVEILEPKRIGGHRILEPSGKIGMFHQFGNDFEEFEEGPGNFTTAVVEMPDGFMQNIPVEFIRFKDTLS